VKHENIRMTKGGFRGGYGRGYKSGYEGGYVKVGMVAT